MANLTLWEQIKELKSPKYKWVDLTHELSPETPHWFGFKPLQADLLFDYAEGTPDDMMAPMRCIQYSVASQYGTHVDAPRHFHEKGRTMAEMAAKEIIPAVSRAQGEMAKTVSYKQSICIGTEPEMRILREGAALLNELDAACGKLNAALKYADESDGAHERACRCRDAVVPAMAAVRHAADALETITPHEAWPFPNYEQLLLNAE